MSLSKPKLPATSIARLYTLTQITLNVGKDRCEVSTLLQSLTRIDSQHANGREKQDNNNADNDDNDDDDDGTQRDRGNSLGPSFDESAPVGRRPLGWLGGTAVERRSLADELSLSCARPVADG